MRTGSGTNVHSALSHDLDKFESEGGNVVLDLVDVVFGHALVVGLALLLSHVAAN